MRPVNEGRHDTEIPATAAQTPEQIRIDLVIGGDEISFGGDDFTGEDIPGAAKSGPGQFCPLCCTDQQPGEVSPPHALS